MKKISITDIASILLLLLFVYTSTSKFLDYGKFVFQMGLAPLPLMKILAPILGWLMPSIELILAGLLAVGMLLPRFQLSGIYASLILLILFEIYIGGMLLSGHALPCTCGGIISKMNWKQHLYFNLFFIAICIEAIRKSKITGTKVIVSGSTS